MGKGKNTTKWKEDKKERFMNPYNFIPLQGTCQRTSVDPMPGKFTGYLACQLEVLTPLFIPNTSNPKALHKSKEGLMDDSYSYDFFSYTDLGSDPGKALETYHKPVIPGSEIRGVVRSVFEAAFQGCLSSVDLTRPLGRRALSPNSPGILQRTKGQWKIIPCKRWKLNASGHFRGESAEGVYPNWEEGKELYVKESKFRGTEWKEDKEQGFKKGYLHKGEAFQGKKYESVFLPDNEKNNENTTIPVSEEDVARLKEVIRQYQDPKINFRLKGKDGLKGWYSGYEIQEERTLVYYHHTPGLPVYMAPACIGKEVFANTIGQLLQSNGGYQPCENRELLCPACALFGMVPKSSQKSPKGRASRVRFEDATLIQPLAWENCYRKDITLPEMGQPKPSAVEFYTFPPEEKHKGASSYGYWTYDYKLQGENRSPLQDKPLRLRGRKFYWHSSEAWKKYLNRQPVPPNKMRQKIRPLRESLTFQFRVYFEHITEEELNRLYWALTFQDPRGAKEQAEDKEKTIWAHKMGRGKPLGFGSVHIGVEKIYIRKIDPQTGAWSCRPMEPKGSIEETDSMKKIKIMANWTLRPKAKVSYPVVQNLKQGDKNSTASHQWFTGNRERVKDGKTKSVFAKVLPTLEEEVNDQDPEDKWLYKLVKQ